MYKLLLCLRYLRTRWIALASIVSVTLGVATMIVVNSVMAGFTCEMQERIKGILSDISFESKSLSGFRDPADHMRRIEAVAGDYIDSMSASVNVFAMLSFEVNGESINRAVQLIGGDPKTMGKVGSFNGYLQHPEHRRGNFDFQLREAGYDTRDHQGGDEAALRRGMELAGWELRRRKARWLKAMQADQADRPGQRRDAAWHSARRIGQGRADRRPQSPASDEVPAPVSTRRRARQSRPRWERR